MDLLRKLFSSQKFLVFLASSIGLLITKVFKIEVEQTTILMFVGLVSAWLLSQGASDLGKGAAKVEAIAAISGTRSTPAKQIEEIKSV